MFRNDHPPAPSETLPKIHPIRQVKAFLLKIAGLFNPKIRFQPRMGIKCDSQSVSEQLSEVRTGWIKETGQRVAGDGLLGPSNTEGLPGYRLGYRGLLGSAVAQNRAGQGVKSVGHFRWRQMLANCPTSIRVSSVLVGEWGTG